MSDPTNLDQYIADGWVYENPDDKTEVIYAPKIRIAKADVLAGCFEAAAAVDGWYPQSGIAAPQVCQAGIIKFANAKNHEAVAKIFAAEAAAKLAAWEASRQ